MNIIRRTFEELEKNGIRICHFKSNRNLDQSFAGKADFDVLISGSFRSRCAEILLKNGCKRFEPQYIGWYPGVENWLAFDEETGIIYHIHLHNQLASGKKLLKDYILPWGDLILQTSVFNEEYGIYTSDPNAEMILLLSRISIKTRLSDVMKARIGTWKLSGDMQQEFEWLRGIIDKENFCRFAESMYPHTDVSFFWNLTQSKTISPSQFRKLRRIVIRRLTYEHWYGNSKGYFKSISLRTADLWHKLRARKFGALVNTKKVPTAGGRIIAFVGADGSGKSTVAADIRAWLNKKADCESVYMGEGDGKKTLFATVTRKFYHKIKKRGSGSPANVNVQDAGKPKKLSKKQYIVKYIHALTIYSIAKDNHKKIIRMYRRKLMGCFSVLDRYPQTQLKGRNDGPKLEGYAKELNSKHIAKLAEKEERLLSIADEIQPDLIFRLQTTPELSQKRKPDEITDLRGLQFKIDELNSIRFPKAEVIDIDTAQDYNDEILEIKKMIWEKLG